MLLLQLVLQHLMLVLQVILMLALQNFLLELQDLLNLLLLQLLLEELLFPWAHRPRLSLMDVQLVDQALHPYEHSIRVRETLPTTH